MEQKKINKIRDKAVASSSRCSCEDILIKSGMSYRRRGNQLYLFCPNCDRDQFLIDRAEKGKSQNDRAFTGREIPDHCSVNIRKNKYFCFTCSAEKKNGRVISAGGGPAKLYSLIYDVPYIDAALILAGKAGDVSEEEINLAKSSPDALKKFREASENIATVEEREAMKEAEVKAPSEVCNIVYRALISLPEFALTRGHYEYLASTRHLSDAEIREGMFFSYTKTFSFEELFARIKAVKPDFTPAALYGVPGFFFEEIKEGKGKWHFKAPMPNCIGIPLKNAYGEIVALQMRNLERNAKNKYFYVSSKYESQKNKAYGYGASPGSPVAVFYPPSIDIPTFYIGEGYFKMREIAKEGAVAFSVQGVNSLSYVTEEITRVLSLLPQLKTSLKSNEQIKLFIVFDADMYSNVHVLEAGFRAAYIFAKKFRGRPISFLLWRDEYGKGFDDMKYHLLQNHIDYREKIVAVPQQSFIKLVRPAVVASDEEYMKTHPEMTISDRGRKEYGRLLYDRLYNQTIKNLLP